MGRPPRHTHIAEQLRNKLHDGTYPPYERMPSNRDLAEELGASQTTVQRAMHRLQEDGLVWANTTGAFAMNAANVIQEPPAWQIFTLFGIPPHVVDDVLAIHAHELAEKQRLWAKDILDHTTVIEADRLATIVTATVSLVTDLIDPKEG